MRIQFMRRLLKIQAARSVTISATLYNKYSKYYKVVKILLRGLSPRFRGLLRQTHLRDVDAADEPPRRP